MYKIHFERLEMRFYLLILVNFLAPDPYSQTNPDPAPGEPNQCESMRVGFQIRNTGPCIYFSKDFCKSESLEADVRGTDKLRKHEKKFSTFKMTHSGVPLKGTVRPDWICMRVVSLESPLKGHQPLYVFNF